MTRKIIPIKYFNVHKMSFCFTKYNIKDFIIIYNLIEDLEDVLEELEDELESHLNDRNAGH